MGVDSSNAPLGPNEVLDAFSATVSRVAASVSPHVAVFEVWGQRHAGAGPAVVLTDDGYLVTNAHVVASAAAGDRPLPRRVGDGR